MIRTGTAFAALLLATVAHGQTLPTPQYTERGVISALRFSGFDARSGETFIDLKGVVAQHCGPPNIFGFQARIGYPPQVGDLQSYLAWHQLLLKASIKQTPISITYFCGPGAEVVALSDILPSRKARKQP